MSYNCPVCNKAGLPDFTKTVVKCPQCNSDLKAFMLLNTIAQPQKSKIGAFLIIGISLFSIVFFGLFLKSSFEKKELVTQSIILTDSINKILTEKVYQKKANEENEKISATEKQEFFIKYKVKKGDYLYKISEFFYNDGSKYLQIAVDNNLNEPYTLKVGQILIIKISQEQW